MFRILTKIPYFVLLIYSFILLFLTAFLVPFGTDSDLFFLNLIADKSAWGLKETINVHLIFSNFLYLIVDALEITSLSGYRSLNLIYYSLSLLTLYKIIKFQFYDLKIIPVITAVTCTGITFISFVSPQGVLLTGLLALVIFYFQIKFFAEENIYNSFFLGLFCIISLSLSSYFFLIIVTTLSILKLSDWKLEKNKRWAILSNLSFIYISVVIFIVLDQIYGKQLNFKTSFELTEILYRIYLAAGLLLPIIGILIISLYFNFYKKINWNKDLFLYLLILIVSLIAFLFLNYQNFTVLLFILPILVVYIFRTLEFVELKWLRILYLSFLFLPFLIIYFDTSFYPNIEAVPKLNYFFYALVLFIGILNPAFSLQTQPFVESYKAIIVSFLLLLSISLGFLHLNYHNKFLHMGIASTIAKDLSCKLENTQIIANQEIPAIKIYFFKNISPSYFPDCEIEILFTSIEDTPIDNPSSINKTLLDLNQKSFINVNFIKK